MKKILYAIWSLLGILVIVGISVTIYSIVDLSLTHAVADRDGPIDYTNIAVVLLTTVTVVFSIFAIALAALGVWGFNNIKKEAGKFARGTAHRAIKDAYLKGGPAHQQIRSELLSSDSDFRRLLEQEIEKGIIAYRSVYGHTPGMDPDTPTDEGDIN